MEFLNLNWADRGTILKAFARTVGIFEISHGSYQPFNFLPKNGLLANTDILSSRKTMTWMLLCTNIATDIRNSPVSIAC